MNCPQTGSGGTGRVVDVGGNRSQQILPGTGQARSSGRQVSGGSKLGIEEYRVGIKSRSGAPLFQGTIVGGKHPAQERTRSKQVVVIHFYHGVDSRGSLMIDCQAGVGAEDVVDDAVAGRLVAVEVKSLTRAGGAYTVVVEVGIVESVEDVNGLVAGGGSRLEEVVGDEPAVVGIIHTQGIAIPSGNTVAQHFQVARAGINCYSVVVTIGCSVHHIVVEGDPVHVFQVHGPCIHASNRVAGDDGARRAVGVVAHMDDSMRSSRDGVVKEADIGGNSGSG